MKTIFSILTLIYASFSIAQTRTLSEQMWERVKTCYSMFEDYDEDGKIDYDELIDDSKNGYLKVSGSYPTCGCSCSHTVGAYKGNDGRYTFVEEEEWTCSWKKKISSSKNLNLLFPENFGIKNFITKANVNLQSTFAMFYLDIEIPRKGTDTKFKIKVIPFGIYMETNNILSYEYSENDNMSNCKPIYKISSIANEIKSEKTLEYLLDKKYNKISNQDMEIINSTLGDDYGSFKSKDELSEQLRELKNIYDLYLKINHETITLGWDRDKARFYVKSKGKPVKQISFKKFLLNNLFWSPVC